MDITPDPRYPMAEFSDPLPYGFLYLGIEAVAPGRAPFVRRNADRDAKAGALKTIAAELTELPGVVSATVYRAVLIPPIPGGPRFDLAMLIETTSPETIPDVQDSEPYRRVNPGFVMPARNIRRIGGTDATRPGTFLFNHFTGPDPDTAVAVWETLTGWYTAKTGIDNSTGLAPIGESRFQFVNYARLPGKAGRFLLSQFIRPSFVKFVRARLRAHELEAMPIFYDRV